MDYRDNRQRWVESHQVVHFYAGQWCTFTPALTVALLYLQIMNMTPSGTKLPCTSQIIPFWQTSIFAQGEKS